MKVLPFNYTIPTGQAFSRFEPDLIIALANQLLFYGTLILTFLLARRLFDPGVAWVASLVLLFSELLWRFSVSGLSTMLLMLIFMGLIWCLVLLEHEAREPKHGPGVILLFGVLCGLLAGLGGLTRYSFGWLIVPVLVFIALFGGARKVPAALLALAAFALVMGPWIGRNYAISGTPFGTAGFSILESTFIFPDYRLQRSLEPELTRPVSFVVHAFWNKLMANSRLLLQNDLPKLGGTWIAAFFLVGLLITFRNPAIKRLRYFTVATLLVLLVVQALGRTRLSEDAPDINSENLLVLLTPLVLVYGVSLFFMLLEQMVLPVLELRYAVIVIFTAIACIPMVYVFLPPAVSPIAFPPYYPPAIQTLCGWMKPNELIMSDVPWAVAWYGQRQCTWLTLRATPERRDLAGREDFFAINDYMKPIQAVYLTPITTDARFITDWAGDRSWGSFVLQTSIAKEVPPGWPLAKSPDLKNYGLFSNQIVLTDWERWKKEP